VGCKTTEWGKALVECDPVMVQRLKFKKENEGHSYLEIK
jgi:hypothetical protein